MLGFVNGLAIVIFLAQLGQFKVPDGAGRPRVDDGQCALHYAWFSGANHGYYSLFTKINNRSTFSLVAIVTVTGLVIGLDLEARYCT